MPVIKLRVEISKDEEIRYISHLDYAGAIEKALKRAEIPVAYSEGFNPHMKLAFASALAVGLTSATEYMEVELKDQIDIKEFIAKFEKQLPRGIKVLQAKYLMKKEKALMAIVDLATYCIEVPLLGSVEAAIEALENFNKVAELKYLKITPKQSKEIEIKQYLKESIKAEFHNSIMKITMAIIITPGGSVKPTDVLTAITENFALNIKSDDALIHRTGLYANGKSPIDLI